MSFDDARAVADAVLFEGYALYPYRPSAPKNRLRWQFGVLAPQARSEAGGTEAWWQETACLVQPAADAPPRLAGRLRFLQLERHDAQAPAAQRGWDEGAVQELDFAFDLVDPPPGVPRRLPFTVAGADDAGQGARRRPLAGVLRLETSRFAARHPLLQVRLRVENVSEGIAPGAPRDEALASSLLGVHVLLEVTGGDFVSLLDPPPWAAPFAARCHNVRTYPVLAGKEGRRDLLLSAPVILYDHPMVAPESQRDLFDATEIDEILSLRILTLTDEEKREVRATDPRLRALLDGVERLGAEGMARLHGASRAPRPAVPPAAIPIDGILVAPGSRVRLRPGPRRTDAQDMFLDGLTATVEAIEQDMEGQLHAAVLVEDDPGNELRRLQRRYFYFRPDELEPSP